MIEQKEVLAATKNALEDAFGPNHKHTVKITSTSAHEITPEIGSNGERKNLCPSLDEPYNTILAQINTIADATPVSKVIEACNQATETPVKQKSIAEAKKLIESFKGNIRKYPKYLSYEGSVVLCVILSIDDTRIVNIGGLPTIDQDLILSQLPPNAAIKLAAKAAILEVEFDEIKDFIITYSEDYTYKISSEKNPKIYFFNSVIHPPKQEPTEVPIEQDGDTVKVGSKLVLDQKRIQKLAGPLQHDKKRDDEEEPPRRQVVSGRNAFELRCDLVSMAMELLFHNNKSNDISPEKVISTAKILYSFVENKR